MKNWANESARLETIFDLVQKEARIEEIKKQSSDNAFWNHPPRAQTLMQELKTLESSLKRYTKLQQEIEDNLALLEMGKEDTDSSLEDEINQSLKRLEVEIEKIELETYLNGRYDKNGAILTLNAGAGGTDAQDWAEMLLRMYTRWAENKEYQVSLVDVSYGDEAGIKSAMLTIEGLYAYGYLKAERGIHRLVRLSPFNADQKRHTSFASVEAIPELEEDAKLEINSKDLRIDTYRASGPGGQNVNKTSSAVRITHIPTGIVGACQNERSQHQNRDMAMRLLKSKLQQLLDEEHKEKLEELRGKLKKIEWGSQIRSYVFHPYTMVKDHRTGAETSNVQKVMDGELDMFIESYLKEMR